MTKWTIPVDLLHLASGKAHFLAGNPWNKINKITQPLKMKVLWYFALIKLLCNENYVIGNVLYLFNWLIQSGRYQLFTIWDGLAQVKFLAVIKILIPFSKRFKPDSCKAYPKCGLKSGSSVEKALKVSNFWFDSFKSFKIGQRQVGTLAIVIKP